MHHISNEIIFELALRTKIDTSIEVNHAIGLLVFPMRIALFLKRAYMPLISSTWLTRPIGNFQQQTPIGENTFFSTQVTNWKSMKN